MGKDHIAHVMELWGAKNKVLEPVRKELIIDMIDQIASLFSAGSYYYYVVNFETLKMEYVDEGVNDVLGVSTSEFTLEKVLELMHPDDIPKMYEKEETVLNFLFKKIPLEEILSYKVVYLFRLKHKDGTYKTILHQAKTLTMSKDGKIEQVMGVHTDVTHLNIPMNHKISFISRKRPSYYAIDPTAPINLEENSFKKQFSKREIEVIRLLSKGNTLNEIAELLVVSPHTIHAHKRNVLKKSGCRNSTELIARCIVEGVI